MFLNTGSEKKDGLTVKGNECQFQPQIRKFKILHEGVPAVAGVDWPCGEVWVFAFTSQVEPISTLQNPTM